MYSSFLQATAKFRCRLTSSAQRRRRTASAIRPCMRATGARSRRRPPACISTPQFLPRSKSRHVRPAFVTLHVGAGTFAPVRTADIDSHQMHEEYLEVPEAACAAINATRDEGGRVIAVGTTVVRSLETAAAGSAAQPLAPFPRQHAHIHQARPSISRRRCLAHQFSSARIDAADVVRRLRRPGSAAIAPMRTPCTHAIDFSATVMPCF